VVATGTPPSALKGSHTGLRHGNLNEARETQDGMGGRAPAKGRPDRRQALCLESEEVALATGRRPANGGFSVIRSVCSGLTIRQKMLGIFYSVLPLSQSHPVLVSMALGLTGIALDSGRVIFGNCHCPGVVM